MCVYVFNFLQIQAEFNKQAVICHFEYAGQNIKSLDPIWPKSRQAELGNWSTNSSTHLWTPFYCIFSPSRFGKTVFTLSNGRKL